MTAASSRPWLAQYSPGVPHDLAPGDFESIPAMMEMSVARYGSRPAFENFGVTASFDDIDRHARHFAAYLQSVLGLAKGDRVAIMMPNLIDYPIALFGILRAGLVVVSVNPLYTHRELEHQLIDSGAKAIVIFEGAVHTLAGVIAATKIEHVIVAAVGDMLGFPKGAVINFVLRHVKKLVPAWTLPQAVRFNDALARGARATFAPPVIGPDDLAFLQYTGGTTGVSKGAMLLHRMVLANVEQMRLHASPVIHEGDDNVAVGALPFYHILALVMNCMLFFRLGSRQLLITNPKDIPRFVAALAKSRFTFIVGVNTLYNALLNHPDFAKVDVSRLRMAGGGGAPLQLPVAQRWKAVTGKTLVEGYGLTETSGATSCNRVTLEEHTGTTGVPLPGVHIQIRDDDGRVMPHGETGQVFVQGPNVMAGYWQRPDETAKVLGADGFLATGDVGLITPEGYLKIVDRLKDMVLVSGFNVFPNEIEDVLAGHPGIVEAAAIGIPDPHTGEAVKVVIVRRDPALTAESVIAYCREQLTGYKLPKHVEFRDTLPKSPIGKILRRELRGN